MLAACLLLALRGERPEVHGQESPPNLVLLTLDTTRADHFGCYGYFRDTTPRIDELAAESLLFERCLAPMGTTLPSHTSLMTGTYPLEHGIVANFKDRGLKFHPSEKLQSLASVLLAAGYATAGFVSATPLKSHSGIDVGFTHFDEPSEAERRADETNREMFDWLKKTPQVPFFLWVHYFDPHGAHEPPAPYDSEYRTGKPLKAYMQERRISEAPGRDGGELINAYDGEIRFLDAQIGALLDALHARPDWGRTIVVLVADHGEGVGQHQKRGHGSVWDEVLRVPLLVRVPQRPGRRVSVPIGLSDVLSTLAGLVPELPLQPLLSQSSGRDAFAGGTSPGYLGLAVRRNVDEEARSALTTLEWKFVLVPGRQNLLFHRPSDPFELVNVRRKHPEVAQALRAQLEEMIERQKARGLELRSDAPEETLTAEQLEQLQALGYGGDE